MNLIAMITLGGQDCLSTCMPAQNHEDIFVFADQFPPDRFPCVSLDLVSQFFEPFSICSHVGMSQNDNAMYGMFGNHFVRPIQNFVAWFAFQRHDEELHSGRIDMIPRIIMAFRVVGSAEFLGLGKFFPRKIFIEVSGPVYGCLLYTSPSPRDS